MISDYFLEDFARYRYLNNGNLSVPGVNDSEEFQNTIKAMRIMNMSNEELHSIFLTLSAVLQLGNLQFKPERNSDQAALPDDTVAQKICRLFSIPVTDFVRALLKPKIPVGRDFVVKAQTQTQVKKIDFLSKQQTFLRIFRSNSLLKRFLKRFTNECSNG